MGTRYETCNGQPFFRGSVSSTDGGISCIVASDAQLDLLSTIVQNCMSMPHKTVPRQFYQSFTIFVTRQDFVFPVCFILMTRKSKELYVTSFRRLHELAPNFQPSRVMADYEDGHATFCKQCVDTRCREWPLPYLQRTYKHNYAVLQLDISFFNVYIFSYDFF